MGNSIIDRISDGRTDAVFDLLAAGQAAGAKDGDGVAVIQKCAYYGDVSAIRFLMLSSVFTPTTSAWKSTCSGSRIYSHAGKARPLT